MPVAVRRRTRRRWFGEHALARSGVGRPLNANVPEPCFQTLERHWETVVARVAAFVDMLVQRTRS